MIKPLAVLVLMLGSILGLAWASRYDETPSTLIDADILDSRIEQRFREDADLTIIYAEEPEFHRVDLTL